MRKQRFTEERQYDNMVDQLYFDIFEEEGVWMVHAAAEAENPDGEYHCLKTSLEEVLTDRKDLVDCYGEKCVAIDVSNKRMYRYFPAVAEVFEEEDGMVSELNFMGRVVYHSIYINGRYMQNHRDVQLVKKHYLLRLKEEKLANLWNTVFGDAQPDFEEISGNQIYLENILFMIDMAFQFPGRLKTIEEEYFESEAEFKRFFMISAYDSKITALRKITAKGTELMGKINGGMTNEEEPVV